MMKLSIAAVVAALLCSAPLTARAEDLRGDDRGDCDRRSPRLPLQGTPNPDRARIKGGEELLEVTASGSARSIGPHALAKVSPYQEDLADLGHGTDVATEDVRNVQWAVQNVRAGGTVLLRRGPRGEAFQFGTSGIYLPGVNLIGEGRDETGAPRAVIAGGLLPIRANFLSPGDEVKVSNLWFQGTTEAAIYSGMGEYDRLEVSGNKSTGTVAEDFLIHPPNGHFFQGKIQGFVWSFGTAAVPPYTGAHAPRSKISRVVIKDNVDDQFYGGNTPSGGGSELELAFCDYGSIEIANNTVSSTEMAVELQSNTSATGEIAIVGNRFTAPGGGIGVWSVDNQGRLLVIDRNTIEAGSIGLVLTHHTPHANLFVTRNHLTLDNATAALVPGLPGFAADRLNGAVFADNTFAGAAAFAVLAYDAPPDFLNTSSNNLFVRNDFSGLATFALQVFLGAETTYNVFTGNTGLDPAKFVSLNPTNTIK